MATECRCTCCGGGSDGDILTWGRFDLFFFRKLRKKFNLAEPLSGDFKEGKQKIQSLLEKRNRNSKLVVILKQKSYNDCKNDCMSFYRFALVLKLSFHQYKIFHRSKYKLS